jgi:hypothetical protein
MSVGGGWEEQGKKRARLFEFQCGLGRRAAARGSAANITPNLSHAKTSQDQAGDGTTYTYMQARLAKPLDVYTTLRQTLLQQTPRPHRLSLVQRDRLRLCERVDRPSPTEPPEAAVLVTAVWESRSIVDGGVVYMNT